jgi:hypothetical protein
MSYHPHAPAYRQAGFPSPIKGEGKLGFFLVFKPEKNYINSEKP